MVVVGFTHFNACNFCNGIRLVGVFKCVGKQITFFKWLRRKFRVNTRAAKEHQFFYTCQITLVDDVVLNLEVVINEISPIGIVGMYTANTRCRQEYIVWFFSLKKIYNSLLAS